MNEDLSKEIVISIVGLSQCILVLLYISKFYLNRTENKILIAILAFLSLSFLELIVNTLFDINKMKNLLFINHLNSLVLGPLFLIYSLEISDNKTLSFKQKLLLFSPKLFFLIYFILNYHVQSNVAKYEFLNKLESNFVIQIVFPFSLFYTICCLILALCIVWDFNLKASQKEKKKSHLKILQLTNLTYFLICIMSLIELTLANTEFNNNYHNFTVYQTTLFYLFSCFLILYIFRNPKVLLKKKLLNNNFAGIADSQEMAKKIEDTLELKKLYLDENLRLEDLAQSIGKPAKQISEFLSTYYQSSYSNFIHEFRVKYFIGLILKGEHKKKVLYSLALDSGFKSKAVFNRAFKKKTGKTPTEFIKQLELVSNSEFDTK